MSHRTPDNLSETALRWLRETRVLTELYLERRDTIQEIGRRQRYQDGFGEELERVETLTSDITSSILRVRHLEREGEHPVGLSALTGHHDGTDVEYALIALMVNIGIDDSVESEFTCVGEVTEIMGGKDVETMVTVKLLFATASPLRRFITYVQREALTACQNPQLTENSWRTCLGLPPDPAFPDIMAPLLPRR